MDVEQVRYDGGGKFMWDGEIYESREDMDARRKDYTDAGFEVRVYEQEGRFLLYTRRVVTEIVLEGPPPA